MASRLQDVILRGFTVDKPLATAVAPGTLYYSIDDTITERSNGSVWESYTDGGGGSTPTPVKRQVTLVIDGGGSPITAGLKSFLSLPAAGTWKKWRLLADVAGSIVIDIWKDTYTNFPPVLADTITAAAKPTLVTAAKNEDLVLTGWNTAFLAGDILAFNVDSAATVTKVSLTLEFE